MSHHFRGSPTARKVNPAPNPVIMMAGDRQLGESMAKFRRALGKKDR
jgi:hypothetical protein